MLIGHGAECERARDIQSTLPPSILGRIWDITGQTTIHELAQTLTRCHHVIGSDTGPLHLAAAVGTPTLGGISHEPGSRNRSLWHRSPHLASPERRWGAVVPTTWPIEPTLDALVNQTPRMQTPWSQWTSQTDGWGTYYTEAGESSASPREREALWHELSPAIPA